MTIHVHIERLLLDGFEITPAERTHLQNAVEHELAHLLAAQNPQPGESPRADNPNTNSMRNEVQPLSRAGGAVPSTTAGPFNPPKGATPTQLGQHIAQSIHGGLGNRK
jgi:hypothetical protein